MKITIVLLLITLGLVCSAYAAPTDAEAQLFGFGLLKKLGSKLKEKLKNRICGSSPVQTPAILQDEDEDLADIESIMQSLAEAQDGNDEDDADDGDDAQIEALLQSYEEQAQIENFWRRLGDVVKKSLPYVRKSLPYVKTGLDLIGKKK